MLFDSNNDEENLFNMSSHDDSESAEKDEIKPKTLTRKEVLDILQTTKDFSGMDLRKANLSKLDL